ncbi:MAG: Rieske 2Fe-2S domain-containing protein [Ktedonobacterales bacterium]|nr:Rieske 2Fe-2S domain-containing protein [Ktedonobacterales bacterium]
MQDTVNVIERQPWLEPASDTVQRGLYHAVNAGGPLGRRISDFLNGSRLGHPLHPAVTDVPIGAWTVALALDGVQMLTKARRFLPGADAAVAIGLVGALFSAASGLADWQYSAGRARRIGLAHALLNTTATSLYATSFICRLRGKRKSGQLTGTLGFAAVCVGSFLGGDLSYRERMGMNHAPDQEPPDDFTPVLAERELAEGALKHVRAGDVTVVLARRGGRVYALAESCAHLGGPLSEGTLEGESIVCPWHGSRFALKDGHVLNGPSTFAQPCYETRLRDGLIEVRGRPHQ